MRNRKLFKEAFKAGYKKALRQMRKLNEAVDSTALDPAFQDVEETIAAAVEEAGENGVDDIHGIIDYWQQVYGDDVLYGYNTEPLNVDELAAAFCEGFAQAGIKADCTELADILQSYLDLRDDFESRF